MDNFITSTSIRPDILDNHVYNNYGDIGGMSTDNSPSLYRHYDGDNEYNIYNYTKEYELPKKTPVKIINKWIKCNKNRIITYIILKDKYYEIYKVKIERYDEKKRKIYFK